MNINCADHTTKSWAFAWRMALWLLCIAPVTAIYLVVSGIQAAASGWEAFFGAIARDSKDLRNAIMGSYKNLAEVFGRPDRPRGDTELS